jgi:hypothetical protein
MKIILNNHLTDDIKEKYVVLELDTIRSADYPESLTAHALVDMSCFSLEEITEMDQYIELHENLMSHYRLKNWKYCEDAIEVLLDRWRGELRTFYQDLLSRISTLKELDLSPDWDGSITR